MGESGQSSNRQMATEVHDRALARRLRAVKGKSGIPWVDRAMDQGKPSPAQRPYRVLAPLGFVALAVVLLSLFLFYGAAFPLRAPSTDRLPEQTGVTNSDAR